jgi:Patatin-like phospholipase
MSSPSPSLPLELHEVLEQEYVSMYGPIANRPERGYSAAQILDVAWAATILRDCGRPAATTAEEIATALTALVMNSEPLDAFDDSLAITELGRTLLKDYAGYLKSAQEKAISLGLTAADGAQELRRTILDETFTGAVKPHRETHLEAVYKAIHDRAKAGKPRTALSISGGGIRSATFALGVMQGLASASILDKFDFLSTVSGGGYIGSWLTSWIRRHPRGVTGVQEDLQRADTAVDQTTAATDGERRKLNPEPEPLRHLREYSNYLSPRLGILSADSWTLGSLYLRNLLLNLLVLVPIMALALAVPRALSFALSRDSFAAVDTSMRHYALAWPWIAAIGLALGFGYLGRKRPVEQGRKAKAITSDGAFILGCILPLTGAAVSISIFWAHAAHHHDLLLHPSTIAAVVAAVLAMTMIPYFLYYSRYKKALASESRTAFAREDARQQELNRKRFDEFKATGIALLTAMALLTLLALKVFNDPRQQTPNPSIPPIERVGMPASPAAQLYTCFAVPLILLVFFVQASIFVGLSSKHNEDFDREWWGRAGAWLLFAAAAIAALNVIGVFGPLLFYYAPIIVSGIGAIAGGAAALFGYSEKTPAQDGAHQQSTASKLVSALTVPVFVIALLSAISLGTTWLIQRFEADNPVLERQNAEASLLSARHTQVQTFKSATGRQMEVRYQTTPVTQLSMPAYNAYRHLKLIYDTNGVQLLSILGVALIAVWLSRLIGVNKFSMHALYRNRLIRAYLGASRYSRDPDRFTGFDENDNMDMWELRRELLWSTSFKDPKAFVDALKDASRPASKKLWSLLETSTKEALNKGINASSLTALVQNLNAILQSEDLGELEPDWVKTAPTQIGYPQFFRNRAALDAAFPESLNPMAPPADVKDAPRSNIEPAPLHIVNTALNLTGGENLAWQQRMAESFTISPYYSGSLFLGYRDSKQYGGAISLGTAVTISGAAASPNMGYHTSPLIAFLLTVFNIRLGAWLGNPGVHGDKTFTEKHPTSSLIPLQKELTASANDRSKWVYLSDGGHFENLGMYEMVLRRCHRIVVSDGGADPTYNFEDLGNAIRKIRTDLGVPIDIQQIDMRPRGANLQPVKGRYVAVATIRYKAVDGPGAVDGQLIYIKPGIYKGDYFPQDVYNYCQQSPAFPHEPTSDQFFSESQFESYRALGRHAINEICGNYPPKNAVADARIPIAKKYASVADFTAFFFPQEEKKRESTIVR